MANTFNTGVYPQEWMTSLQRRLNHPTTWKEVANVIYSNVQIFNVPYIPTANEPVMQTGTRGTAYGFTDFTVTNNTLTINTYKPISVFIDQADLAQCTLVNSVQMGELQGKKINEWVESAMLGDHASWTNIGDTGGGAIGLATTQITVSQTNIDDIIRGVKREIVKANGLDLASENGVFFVWRPQDFEMLENFAQANGFVTADSYLKNGINGFGSGFHYMDVDHYQSNDFTATHVFAGVKKLYTIGILKATNGQIKQIQDPLNQSGIGMTSRVDYGLLTPTHYLPVLFDVNVA